MQDEQPEKKKPRQVVIADDEISGDGDPRENDDSESGDVDDEMGSADEPPGKMIFVIILFQGSRYRQDSLISKSF